MGTDTPTQTGRWTRRNLAAAWIEAHELPDRLMPLLEAVLNGDRGPALCATLRVDSPSLDALTDEFETLSGTSVYEAAVLAARFGRKSR